MEKAPSTIKKESKHIAKRVLIGVITAVLTTAVVYYLGFNRSASRASQIEIKKNTIKAWKAYVTIENEVQPKYDSNLAKVRRQALDLFAYRSQDSLISERFIEDLGELKKTADIDNEFALLLETRIGYKRQEMSDFFIYFNKFRQIGDSAISQEGKSILLKELNDEHERQRQNFIERVGRSIEDVSLSLTKKFKYPFQIEDFGFNLFYQTLKRSHLNTQPAPKEPLTQPQLPE